MSSYKSLEKFLNEGMEEGNNVELHRPTKKIKKHFKGKTLTSFKSRLFEFTKS